MIRTLAAPFIRIPLIFLLLNCASFGLLHAQKKSSEPSPETYVKTDYEPKLLNTKDFYADIAYPAELFETGKEGIVYFKILLDENGRYLKHFVLKSSDSLFTLAAEKNLKKVIFTPATVRQKPVQYWVTYPVHFKKEFAVKLEASNRVNPKTGKPEGWWTYPSRSLVNSFNEVLLVHYTENDTLFKGKTYRDATLLFEGNYITLNDTLVRHGVFTAFSKEGHKVQEGTFINGQKEGIWESFYENGQLSSSMNYVKDKEDGEMQEFFEDGQLSLSAKYVKGKKDGETQEFFENGIIKRKITYKDGRREGETLKYSEAGRLKLKISFLNNEPYRVIKYNEDGSETEIKEDIAKYGEKMPVFKGDFKKFLYKHLQYPPEANKRNAEGKVYIKFAVNKDGSLEAPEIVKSSGHVDLDKEAFRVALLMNGLWEPGYMEGEPVRIFYVQPFSFFIH